MCDSEVESMLCFLTLDVYDLGAVAVMAMFVVFFALLLNPPTAWVKKYRIRTSSKKAKQGSG